MLWLQRHLATFLNPAIDKRHVSQKLHIQKVTQSSICGGFQERSVAETRIGCVSFVLACHFCHFSYLALGHTISRGIGCALLFTDLESAFTSRVFGVVATGFLYIASNKFIKVQRKKISGEKKTTRKIQLVHASKRKRICQVQRGT